MKDFPKVSILGHWPIMLLYFRDTGASGQSQVTFVPRNIPSDGELSLFPILKC